MKKEKGIVKGRKMYKTMGEAVSALRKKDTRYNMNKMKKEEWEKFWEYLLNRAWNNDTWWLRSWLKEEKERYENEGRRKDRGERAKEK